MTVRTRAPRQLTASWSTSRATLRARVRAAHHLASRHEAQSDGSLSALRLPALAYRATTHARRVPGSRRRCAS